MVPRNAQTDEKEKMATQVDEFGSGKYGIKRTNDTMDITEWLKTQKERESNFNQWLVMWLADDWEVRKVEK